MSQPPRRNLRNCNTCPIVPNPLMVKEDGLSLNNILPDPLKAALHTPTLTCSQITSITTLNPPRTPEEAIRRMRAASEWQAVSIRSMGLLEGGLLGGKGQIEIPNSISANGVQTKGVDMKEGIKVEVENSIYSVLFENELQDFIMNPPPANYDYDFQYYSNLAFHPPNALFSPSTLRSDTHP